MRLIRRHLLREFFFSLALTAAIIAMAAMAYALISPQGRMGLSLLGTADALGFVGLATVEHLGFLLPLIIAMTSVSAYGRAHAAGEIETERRYGSSFVQLLAPALMLGVIAALALLALQDEAIPAAHRQRRQWLHQDLPEKIESLLAQEKVDIRDARFHCRARSAIDAEGHRILRDLMITESRPGEASPRITRAREAIPTLDAEGQRLILALRGLQHDGVLASEALTLSLDLRLLMKKAEGRIKPEGRSYAELDARASKGDLSFAIEEHRRWTLGLSTLAFAGLGALLGLWRRRASRALNFGLGLSTALGFGLLPLLAGLSLAESEGVAAILALYAGPTLSAALSVVLYRRLCRA